jgi:GNAT superfamily N-acetyltransferase
VRFRLATPDDAPALRDLERDANLVALAHVFGDTPYPEAAVLERWSAELDDPTFRVHVVDGPARLDAYVSHDGSVLHHLAVRPERWGSGLGRAAVDLAVQEMTEPRLWCLDLNVAAQEFYRRLGWAPTGRSRTDEWPPHPTTSEWALSRDGPS